MALLLLSELFAPVANLWLARHPPVSVERPPRSPVPVPSRHLPKTRTPRARPTAIKRPCLASIRLLAPRGCLSRPLRLPYSRSIRDSWGACVQPGRPPRLVPPTHAPHGLRQPVFFQHAIITEYLGTYRPSNWTCGRSLCGARPRRTDDRLPLTTDVASPGRQSSMYTYTQPHAGPHPTALPLRIELCLGTEEGLRHICASSGIWFVPHPTSSPSSSPLLAVPSWKSAACLAKRHLHKSSILFHHQSR